MKIFKFLLYAAVATFMATACSDDNSPIIPTPGGDDDPIVTPDEEKECLGFFLLNTGGDGRAASLEYFDFSDNTMSEGWWTLKNADVRDNLGYWGEDVVAHNDYVLATLWDSDLLEICTRTGEHHKDVTIHGCSWIAASKGFAYVTSYYDDCVVKVDIEKGVISGTCATGHQPSGLAIIGNKLYVLNSCEDYIDYDDLGGSEESSISIIDLETFTEVKKVNLGITHAYSPLTVMPDGHSLFLHCNKVGDIAAKSIIFDTSTLSVTKEIPKRSEFFAVSKDKVYVINTYYAEGWKATGFVYDISTDAIIDFPISDESLSSLGIPCGIWIHPNGEEFFIAVEDRSYIYWLDQVGTIKGTFDTGYLPKHLAWDLR